MRRPIRLGMVGGGPASLIGPVHRMAAELDGTFRLVAGAFSSDAERSREAGAGFAVEPARAYADYRAMFKLEQTRMDRIEAVAIVTPNHLHLPVAEAALAAGLHVFCEKPATVTAAEAHRLAAAVRASASSFGLAHSYTGYPMIRQARAMVAEGAIGQLTKVVVEYTQGWLAQPIERTGNKQAAWRADPSQAGLGGCIGDIGVHAFNLAEYVSGDRITSLCADLSAAVADRRLDDDANMLLRFARGAAGILHSSQVATGERNHVHVRLWGGKGGLDWRQDRADELRWTRADAPEQRLCAGGTGLSPVSLHASRLPPGHPEGFIEALANLYGSFGAACRGDCARLDDELPGIVAAVRGMDFIETAIASSRTRQWTTLEETRV